MYYIVVLPGANTIHIANKPNNYPAQYSCKKLSVEEKINQGDPPTSLQQSGTKPTFPELLLSNSQQQESLLNLKKHLKDAHNERKGEILAKNVNKLKAKWSPPNTTYISKAANVTQNKTMEILKFTIKSKSQRQRKVLLTKQYKTQRAN